mgnify:CR=1 FL=1|tara:strand:+ start:5686 stop:5991 length:306 start_codon:yes stop_codon:yes gene_type:complete
MSLWDEIGNSFDDGFGRLIDAGLDRAASEIAPKKPNETAQPKTTPVSEDIGRNANGTSNNQPIYQYPTGSILPGVSNGKLLLAGGSIAVLLALLFIERGRK